MITIGKPVEILLVEDNAGDVGLIEEVFEEAKIRNNIHVAEDGEEAMLYLSGKGKFSGSPRPDIIILDFNLPNKDGREVRSSTDNVLVFSGKISNTPFVHVLKL